MLGKYFDPNTSTRFRHSLMRILANENFSALVVDALRQAGHDVTWIRTAMPGISDQEVLKHAMAEERILVTFDKDFGELAYRSCLPATCGVILFRISVADIVVAASVIVRAIESRDDWHGHFCVVEEHRIRIRPLPS
jgi:predicted nuclease of predicted toxin-antitoxin system